jgi:multisubunit Na+/H+ antiporter MnhC subunit
VTAAVLGFSVTTIVLALIIVLAAGDRPRSWRER